ncbi:MAG: hypothetical protein IJP59_00360 [Muribaculaceae bacterium]|nr:hypothetical protein [Muribaculaceae bacterium]
MLSSHKDGGTLTSNLTVCRRYGNSISQNQASDPNNIYVNINNGSAEIWLENQPVCTTNCKDALEHIVQLLAVKFDANLTNKSEMIYDTVMSW